MVVVFVGVVVVWVVERVFWKVGGKGEFSANEVIGDKQMNFHFVAVFVVLGVGRLFVETEASDGFGQDFGFCHS